MPEPIVIRDASEHNLKGVDLELPLRRLIVITGVSGSGKSSLAHDTLYREGQRRYLESISSYSRQFLSKLDRPAVSHISGLQPAISVDQRTTIRSPRSTVGTMSELHPHLRLLLARVGEPHLSAGGPPIESSLLSFNSPRGACPACRGLGLEDQVDPRLLVGDPARTVRGGALVLTTPGGYLVYSQVTMDVLDQVCQAHGFSVDVPWRELTADQQRVILHGSDRITIPFGKHPLESRLRWSGITAKPRQEGTYRGIIPTIEQILRTKRNKNVLRFVRSVPCSACGGSRLRPESLRVTFHGMNIADLADLTADELSGLARSAPLAPAAEPAGGPLLREIRRRCELLRRLGVGYLQLSRASASLAGGEAQRVRLATQVRSGLGGLLYVLDEPSIGLHHRDLERMLAVMRQLRDAGNTVVVVEHDEATMRGADWLVELGPAAGEAGGEVLYSGPPDGLLADEAPPSLAASPTRSFLLGAQRGGRLPSKRGQAGELWIRGAAARNLCRIDVPLRLRSLNVVTGVSGSGKSTLIREVLARELARRLHGASALPGAHDRIEGATGTIDKLIEIDQSPIGRTPRSNPATYTKVHDLIRALFAGTEAARARGWGKGRFSFNVKGGRCETCQGAGVQTVGMHYLADVEVVCPACRGRRFNEETLDVRYSGRSVADVLDLSIVSARHLFDGHPKITRILQALLDVGLGYLRLGQPATTLSGGEAQRVKLGAELGRGSTGKTLHILDEPTTGLHFADIELLLRILQRLVDRGNTVVVIEHNLDVIRAADWVVDLGPESGPGGGRLLAAGSPEDVAATDGSHTGAALRSRPGGDSSPTQVMTAADRTAPPVRLSGASTHNLRKISVEIPTRAITVITGVSGSGKSSLAMATIAAEGQFRYAAGLSTYARRFMRQAQRPDVETITGLTPVVAIAQQPPVRNPRSTLGTITGIMDDYRLLYSRVGSPRPAVGEELGARLFSFNHHGACPGCRGLGGITRCDPDRLISDPELPLTGGALSGHKSSAAYGAPDGQHAAILHEVGRQLGIDFSRPWSQLAEGERAIAMRGTGERTYTVTWRYRRARRSGQHRWETAWSGFANLIEEEHARKRSDGRAEALRPLMKEEPCGACGGLRLRPEVLAVKIAGRSIGELGGAAVRDAIAFFEALGGPRSELDARALQIADEARRRILRRLRALEQVGLPYLTLDRITSTLSRGELQRARLAGAMDLGLQGVTYVLDEPTVGLHERDTQRLITSLRQLRDAGNTVIVVEHDAEVIRQADMIIDMGPGAGERGGQVVAAATPAELARCDRSATGRSLRRSAAAAARPLPRRPLTDGVHVEAARANNLRGFDLHIPSGGLIVVAGVSGCGKSSLVHDLLLASAARGGPVGCCAISGLDRFEQVILAGDQLRGAGAASTTATAAGLFDRIRDVFARTETARALGFGKGRFSTTARGGRCEECKGAGKRRVGMGFLADLDQTCEACGGARFDAQTLTCKHAGLNISEVLQLTVARAREIFQAQRAILQRLARLEEVGLGYLRLGQETRTLSGGERQRLQISAHLNRRRRGGGAGLLVFDEPTTGLHMEDVGRLTRLFDELVDAGDTLLVVEHHPDLIRRADWLIDLGPEGGDGGGALLGAGTPEDLARGGASPTADLLRRIL